MKSRCGLKSTDSEQQRVYGCCVHGAEPLFYIQGGKVSNYIYIKHNEIYHISVGTQMTMCNRKVICILRVYEMWREDDLTEVACARIGTW